MSASAWAQPRDIDAGERRHDAASPAIDTSAVGHGGTTRDRLRLIEQTLAPVAPRLLTLAVAVLLVALADCALIWLVRPLVDTVLLVRDAETLARFGLVAGGLGVLRLLGEVATRASVAAVEEHVGLRLRARQLAELLGENRLSIERQVIDSIRRRVTDDADAVAGLVGGRASEALGLLLRMMLFGAAIAALQPDLALLALALIPSCWIAADLLAPRLRAKASLVERGMPSLGDTADALRSSISLTRAYGSGQSSLARAMAIAVAGYRRRLAGRRLDSVLVVVMRLFRWAGVLVVAIVGAAFVVQGTLTPGALVASCAFLAALVRIAATLGGLVTAGRIGWAAVGRLGAAVPPGSRVDERADAQRQGRVSGHLDVSGLRFRYGDEPVDVLRQITFSVEPGQRVVLAGPGGSGKSTLAKLLLRLDDPSSGTIRIDGTDIRTLTLASLRQNVGVILHEALVSPGTIRENIAAGRPGATDQQIVIAAMAADAHAFITAMPDSYQTHIGAAGQALARDQQLRIAIARAILRDPPILILDEPTRGISRNAESNPMALLRRLVDGRTAIIFTSDPTLAVEGSAVLLLEDGRIVDRVTPAERPVVDDVAARRGSPSGAQLTGAANSAEPIGRDDPRLLDAARRGDEDALVRLLERHEPLAYEAAKRRAVDSVDAHAAVQEAFFRAVLAVRGGSSLPADVPAFGFWLQAVVIATIRRRQEREASRGPVPVHVQAAERTRGHREPDGGMPTAARSAAS